jgi:hypothetical protein
MPWRGLQHELWLPIGLCWIAALAALLFGHWRAAQVLGAITLLPSAMHVLAITGDFLSGTWPGIVDAWTFLLIHATVVVGLLAYQRDTPVPRRAPWLAALVVGGPALFGLEILMFRTPDQVPVVDWPALAGAALVVAGVVHLVRRDRPAGRTVALALLAAIVFAIRCSSLLDYVMSMPASQRPFLIPLGLAEAAAVLAIGLPLARMAVRELRSPAPALLRM